MKTIMQRQCQMFYTSCVTRFPQKVALRRIESSAQTRRPLKVPTLTKSRAWLCKVENIQHTLASSQVLMKAKNSAKDKPTEESNITSILSDIRSTGTSVLKNFTNAELVILLQKMLKSARYHKLLLPLLEKELVRRMYHLTKAEMLIAADVFSLLTYRKSWNFSSYMLCMNTVLYLRRKELDLSRVEALQVLYYIGMCRQPSTELTAHLEEILIKEENRDHHTLDDITLICHSFFVSYNIITKTDLLNMIAMKVPAKLAMHRIQSFDLVNIIKALYSVDFYSSTFYEQLSESLCKTDWMCMAQMVSMGHMLKAYASVRVGCDELFDQVRKRCLEILADKNQINRMRSKDPILVIAALSKLNSEVPMELIDYVINVFRNEPWLIDNYPREFLQFVYATVSQGHYPQDLIHEVFSEKFLQFIKGTSSGRLESQMLIIEAAVNAELGNHHYRGNRLPQKLQTSWIRMQAPERHIRIDIDLKAGVSQMVAGLQALFKSQAAVELKYILRPFYIIDIAFELDENNRPVRLHGRRYYRRQTYSDVDCIGPSVVNRFITELQVDIPPDSHFGCMHSADITVREPKVNRFHPNRRFTIKMYGRNQYLRDGTKLTGKAEFEVRLLTQLGYYVVLVPSKVGEHMYWMDIASCEEIIKELIIQPLNIELTLKEENKVELEDENNIELKDKNNIELKDKNNIELEDENNIELKDENNIELKNENNVDFKNENYTNSKEDG